MRCVVCGSEIAEGKARYANAWEASLRQHPCCGQGCCDRFNPDTHWMPAEMPTVLPDDVAAQRMEFAKKRLRDGDNPKIVARDMLLAGVPSWMARRALVGAAMAAQKSDAMTRGLSQFAIFGGVFRAIVVGDRNRGVANISEVLGGDDQVDAWEARFGLPSSS